MTVIFLDRPLPPNLGKSELGREEGKEAGDGCGFSYLLIRFP